MAWTLKFGDTEQSFEEWGFSQLTRRTPNRRADIVTFTHDNVLFDQDAEFEFDDEIEIFKDGTRWFSGRVKDAQREASGEAERIVYSVEGVLGWLGDLIFRQPWQYLADYSNPKSSLTTVYVSCVVLFQKADGLIAVLASVREQIQSVFDWVVTEWTDEGISPKFQLDASRIPEFQMPYQEVYNQTCAEILEICFKSMPDVAMWVDYETTPPTVRIARRGTEENFAATPADYLEQVTLTVPDEGEGDDSTVVSVSVQARSELKTPAVCIEYLRTDSINGFVTRFLTQDVWPVGSNVRQFRVLPQVIDLEGSQLVYPQAVLNVRSIDITSADWWRLHDTSLGKTNIQNLVIREPTRSGTLPYEILPNSDSWSPWMGGSGEEDTIEAFGDWDRIEQKTNAAGVVESIVVEKVSNQLLQVRVMTTDKPSGTYNGPAEGTAAEPVPVGMAKAIYEAASQIHYNGQITLEEDECSGSVRVGNVLNIIDSTRKEWATARMLVNEVVEDIDSGKTTIQVGPSECITADDVMTWLRNFRRTNRGLWASRMNGLGFSGGALRVAARPHKQSVIANKEARERLVLIRPDSQTQTAETLTAQIILDILHCGGKQLQVRETQVCIDGDQDWYMRILRSEPYRRSTSPA